MNDHPDSGCPGLPGDGLPSQEEFAQWLKADPANEQAWANIVERIAQGEYGNVPSELRAAAEVFVAKRHLARQLNEVRVKFESALEVMRRPAGTMLAEDRLAQCNARMDELTDALLETPEPHRTRFLKQVVPLRDEIRALRVEPD